MPVYAHGSSSAAAPVVPCPIPAEQSTVRMALPDRLGPTFSEPSPLAETRWLSLLSLHVQSYKPSCAAAGRSGSIGCDAHAAGLPVSQSNRGPPSPDDRSSSRGRTACHCRLFQNTATSRRLASRPRKARTPPVATNEMLNAVAFRPLHHSSHDWTLLLSGCAAAGLRHRHRRREPVRPACAMRAEAWRRRALQLPWKRAAVQAGPSTRRSTVRARCLSAGGARKRVGRHHAPQAGRPHKHHATNDR